MSAPTERFTLRDLPLPAKLVVSTFLISVGLGYLWAMAQIHFKHASPGKAMPGISDLVARFSGQPWPLEPKPEAQPEEVKAPAREVDAGPKIPGIKLQTVLTNRCMTCHGEGGEKSDIPLDKYEHYVKFMEVKPEYPKGHLHKVLTNEAGRGGKFNKSNMIHAFFERGEDWPKKAGDKQDAAVRRGTAELAAVVAWVEAGLPLEQYEADATPLAAGTAENDIPEDLRTQAVPLPKKAPDAKPAGPDKWKVAKGKQLGVEALTQSTHAHLLTFSLLWAATGLIFAFTSHSLTLRCTLAPVVLVAQVLDVACWWLARLDGSGPYFAIAVLGTGAVVGVGLGLQIVLSLFNMYGGKGKAFLLLLFLAGAGLFGITYVKVIEPQLQAEQNLAAQAGN
ncbi:MAG TPA: hypothetical protein VM597_33040 [Gemmataceae bacterium]|nr:hypothetical protein [Gemmataceae bacterium]